MTEKECPFCGTVSVEDASYCDDCGYSLEEEELQEDMPEEV